MKGSENKENKIVLSKRTVYQRLGVELDLEIPAGTLYSNGRQMKKNTTNRELMKAGKAPFVYVTTVDGKQVLIQLELHHATQQETIKGNKYFNGEERDGSIIEIPSITHKTYHKVLHFYRDVSFRVDKRTGGKSFDNMKYIKFRRNYWKDRLKRLEKL